MDLLLKGVLSGAIVVGVLVLARNSRSEAAWLLVLFPAIMLLSFLMVGAGEGPEKLRAVVKASLFATPALLLFIVSIYYGLGQGLDYRLALLLGTGVWILAACSTCAGQPEMRGRRTFWRPMDKARSRYRCHLRRGRTHRSR